MSGSAVAEAEHEDQVSPEDALADARAQLAETQAREANERQRREEAERQAAQAGNYAQGAAEAALTSSITAEEQRLASARVALKQARESGDVDAESAAFEEISSARVQVDRLKHEKTRLSTQQPTRQQQPQPAQNGQSPESQRWIAAHPLFNSDAVYQGTAIGAHNEAIRMGIIESSPAYFAHLEKVLTAQYGENHGRADAMSGTRQPPAAPGRQQKGPPASSYAAPGSRGGGTPRADAADAERIAQEISRMGDSVVTADDIRQFASVNGMTVDEYCKSQAKILAERKGGRTGGMGSDITLR